MANVENINKVIKMIENEKNHFDMCQWFSYKANVEYPENVCGTPACIGGWAESIMRYEQAREFENIPDEYVGEWLGVDSYASYELFYAEYSDVPMEAITREMAIQHLTDIANGEDVDWARYSDERNGRYENNGYDD